MTGNSPSSSQPFSPGRVLTGPWNNHGPAAENRESARRPASRGLPFESNDEPRRLAAFVYADVVGYCSLIGHDDTRTYSRLAHVRRMLIDPALERCGGKLVNAAGDSLLMEFASVISAVRFAVEVQTQIAEFDDEEPPDRRIRFRMGVNAGDAVPDGANIIYGDSVNIAARLQSACPPGGVCVSAMVRNHVPERLDLNFEPLGMLSLKNITRPVEAFVVRLDGHAEVGTPTLRRMQIRILPIFVGLIIALVVGLAVLWYYRSPPIAPRAASILVLPFRNGSGDAEQQYLADAVTSDVTTDLSRMRDVVVISPATAFTYKGKSVEPRQINRDIRVRYLVVGSIRRIGQQVNTNIQLIDAASEVQLWGERFENDFVDLVKLEEGITGRIAASLAVQLVHAEGRRAEQAAAPGALDLRLRATSIFFQSVTPESSMTARNLLIQALRLDPGSADAWALLAQLTASDYFNRWNGIGRDQLDDAEEAARKALLLNPNLAVAHYANGFIQRARGEHYLALEAFNRAIELNPNLAAAYAQKADELILIGRPNEAQPLVEQAIMRSPHDPSLGIFYWFIGRANFFTGQYDQAIPWLRRSVEVRPNLWYNRLYLASAYALKQDVGAAKQTLEDFNRRFPQPAYTIATVIAQESTNPANDPTVVAARARFHQGLLLAGMAEQ